MRNQISLATAMALFFLAAVSQTAGADCQPSVGSSTEQQIASLNERVSELEHQLNPPLWGADHESERQLFVANVLPELLDARTRVRRLMQEGQRCNGRDRAQLRMLFADSEVLTRSLRALFQSTLAPRLYEQVSYHRLRHHQLDLPVLFRRLKEEFDRYEGYCQHSYAGNLRHGALLRFDGVLGGLIELPQADLN